MLPLDTGATAMELWLSSPLPGCTLLLRLCQWRGLGLAGRVAGALALALAVAGGLALAVAGALALNAPQGHFLLRFVVNLSCLPCNNVVPGITKVSHFLHRLLLQIKKLSASIWNPAFLVEIGRENDAGYSIFDMPSFSWDHLSNQFSIDLLRPEHTNTLSLFVCLTLKCTNFHTDGGAVFAAALPLAHLFFVCRQSMIILILEFIVPGGPRCQLPFQLVLAWYCIKLYAQNFMYFTNM